MKTAFPILAVFLLASIAQGQMLPMANRINNGSIFVQGQAGIDVTPDKVVISLGIETNDMEVQIAKKANTAIHQKVMAIFKDLKIEPKNIQTDQLTIEPRYDHYNNKRNFLGYWVNNNVAVTLTDIEKIEPLLTSVLEVGVTHVYGVDFQVTEFKKYRQQARIMAVKAAKEKAQEMIEVLGQKVGKPTRVSEGWSGIYYNNFRDSRRDQSHMMMQNTVSNQTNNGPTDGTVAMGKVHISATVDVTFQIIDPDDQAQDAK